MPRKFAKIAAARNGSAIADQLQLLFIQFDVAGYWTQLFERWPKNVQCDLRQAIELEPVPPGLHAESGQMAEQPLAACCLDGATWTLLTDQRLIWRHAGLQAQLLWREIGDVKIDDVAIIRRSPLGRPLTQRMLIVGLDGAAHALELKAGPPFSWFWMALKMIANGHRQ